VAITALPLEAVCQQTLQKVKTRFREKSQPKEVHKTTYHMKLRAAKSLTLGVEMR
jgi:hypothetical protein